MCGIGTQVLDNPCDTDIDTRLRSRAPVGQKHADIAGVTGVTVGAGVGANTR